MDGIDNKDLRDGVYLFEVRYNGIAYGLAINEILWDFHREYFAGVGEMASLLTMLVIKTGDEDELVDMDSFIGESFEEIKDYFTSMLKFTDVVNMDLDK